MPITITGTSGADLLQGGYSSGDPLNEKFLASGGHDTVIGNDGYDTLIGGGGNDILILHTTDASDDSGPEGALASLNGQAGNDTLEASMVDGGQIHMYGGPGDDTFILDVRNDSGRQGHHVYGGEGADEFHFENVHLVNSPIVGRIDDFDASQDSIWIEGQKICLDKLPTTVEIDGGTSVNVSIVSVESEDDYGNPLPSQQFLRIGDNILYALEGARLVPGNSTGEEIHFLDLGVLPSSIDQLPEANFLDQVNYVPESYYDVSGMAGHIKLNISALSHTGTGYSDFLYFKKSVGSNIDGADGDDVINAGQGEDTVTGGNGDDSIAGGLDADLLSGNNGEDFIWGGSENDTISGGDHADHLFGGSGDDSIDGDGGHDSLVGEGGRDTLSGGSGDDTLMGGHWKDVLYGGDGEDVLNGENGNDTIEGGAGKDIVTGENGKDVFVFRSGDLIDVDDLSGTWAEKDAQLDVVTDFEIGNDKLDFSDFSGVDSLADLGATSKTIDGNQYFYVIVPATNERVLVDVEDGTTWGEFFVEDNFVF